MSPSGTITPTSTSRSRFSARSSGERGWRNDARLAGDPRRVALLADRGDRVRAGALDRERAGAHLVAGRAVDRARLAGQDRLVDAERRAPRSSVPSATTWSPGPSRTRSPTTSSVDRDARAARRRGRRSRAARRARRAGRAPASRGSPAPSRSRAFATRTPRKSASCGSPNASVIAPATARIRLKTVKTLARTMLAYERLVDGGGTGPRSARRRSASASLRPAAFGFAATSAVVPTARGGPGVTSRPTARRTRRRPGSAARVSEPTNAGITPRLSVFPFVTRSRMNATEWSPLSRLGPTVPDAPAAASVWHPAHVLEKIAFPSARSTAAVVVVVSRGRRARRLPARPAARRARERERGGDRGGGEPTRVHRREAARVTKACHISPRLGGFPQPRLSGGADAGPDAADDHRWHGDPERRHRAALPDRGCDRPGGAVLRDRAARSGSRAAPRSTGAARSSGLDLDGRDDVAELLLRLRARLGEAVTTADAERARRELYALIDTGDADGG